MVDYDKQLDYLWDVSVETSHRVVHDKLSGVEEIVERLNSLKELDHLLQTMKVDPLLPMEMRSRLEQRARDHLDSYLLAASQSFLRSGQVTVALALARECVRREPSRLESRQQVLEIMDQLNDHHGIIEEIQDLTEREMLINCGDREFIRFIALLCESREILSLSSQVGWVSRKA